MKKTGTLSWVVLALGFLAFTVVQAQNALPPEIARYGTPDQIVVNGKIVSMDDPGLNTNPGRVYEAMALKGNRIMALGSNQQIRSLADRNTKVLDVGGLTVIPGIIDTHAHLFGDERIAAELGIRSPDKGIALQVEAGRDMETTRMIVENALRNAVTQVQAGDWIAMRVAANPDEGVHSSRVAAWVSRGELAPKVRLNQVAPENPVIVRGGDSRYYELRRLGARFGSAARLCGL